MCKRTYIVAKRFKLTIWEGWALGKRVSFGKNECNLFYHKLGGGHFFIRLCFRKKQYFQRRSRKLIFLRAARLIFGVRDIFVTNKNITL